MKNKFKKSIVLILAIVVISYSGIYAYAHPSSQEGILAKTYLPDPYNGYYIGGDNVGWSIDENIHTNGTYITYSFASDPNLSTELIEKVINGAVLWNDVVTIYNVTPLTGSGIIGTYHENNYVVAKSCNFVTGSNGHLTSWEIKINTKFNTQTAVTMAHEFGHIIGLNDLYGQLSTNKLMYYSEARTVSAPAEKDIKGAQVITGVHTTHTWSYLYIGNNSHVKYCTGCYGRTTEISQCTYNQMQFCIYCGASGSVQPW